MSKPTTPSYTLSERSVHLIAQISELIGSIVVRQDMSANPRLRRDNRIKTIHASLAIENNTLSIEQVTAIVNGKRVLGAPSEIHEVKNAFDAYEHLLEFDPFSTADMLEAHQILMSGLTPETGAFRSVGVGVFAEGRLVHMAPPAELVPELIYYLIGWAKGSEAHPLVVSAVFHYEFEFIHPFADGNGRLGRMWQTLILSQWKPLFAWLPIETLIRERQDDYYAVLKRSDSVGDSGIFIEFMLDTICDALNEVASTAQVKDQVAAQVRRILEALGDEMLSAKEIMERLGLKHRQSFRALYLNPALDQGLIDMTLPGKPTSSQQKYRRR